MTLAVLLGKPDYAGNPAFLQLESRLVGNPAFSFEIVHGALEKDYDMLLCVGGDGTYLHAVSMAAPRGIPVLGVNLGRIGFLSENEPSDVGDALLNGTYSIVEHPLLCADAASCAMTALNEIVVSRTGSATLGIKVSLDGNELPTYWADGLLVSTQAGSTAYCLSAGGPIVLPGSQVLVLTPLAPHNLNVRPLVIPQTSCLEMSFEARDSEVYLTADNKSERIPASSIVHVHQAQFSHKRVRLSTSNYINALTGKLFWGEDIRNEVYYKHTVK